VAALALVGCQKRATLAVDHTLPETQTEVASMVPEQILQTAAQSTDPTPRARSLGFLITVAEHPTDGDWAKRALEDDDPWVQRAAVYALAERLPEAKAQELLEQFVATPDADPYVRGAAGIRLVGTHAETALPVLSAAWRSETALWRIAPLALAAAALGDDDAMEPLQRAIRRGELALEVDFVLDLAQSGLPELLPALREGSDWVEEELQLPYAVALVSLGDPSGEQAIRKALNASDVEACLEALDYLAVLDHPTSTSLLKRARSHASHAVRSYASLVLAARMADSPEVFEKAMADADPEIRALAVRYAAEAAQNPTAHRKVSRVGQSLVSGALEDIDPSVRTEAMRAAVKLALRLEDAALDQNLRDPYEALRIEAAGTLLTLQRQP